MAEDNNSAKIKELKDRLDVSNKLMAEQLKLAESRREKEDIVLRALLSKERGNLLTKEGSFSDSAKDFNDLIDNALKTASKDNYDIATLKKEIAKLAAAATSVKSISNENERKSVQAQIAATKKFLDDSLANERSISHKIVKGLGDYGHQIAAVAVGALMKSPVGMLGINWLGEAHKRSIEERREERAAKIEQFQKQAGNVESEIFGIRKGLKSTHDSKIEELEKSIKSLDKSIADFSSPASKKERKELRKAIETETDKDEKDKLKKQLAELVKLHKQDAAKRKDELKKLQEEQALWQAATAKSSESIEDLAKATDKAEKQAGTGGLTGMLGNMPNTMKGTLMATGLVGAGGILGADFIQGLGVGKGFFGSLTKGFSTSITGGLPGVGLAGNALKFSLLGAAIGMPFGLYGILAGVLGGALVGGVLNLFGLDSFKQVGVKLVDSLGLRDLSVTNGKSTAEWISEKIKAFTDWVSDLPTQFSNMLNGKDFDFGIQKFLEKLTHGFTSEGIGKALVGAISDGVNWILGKLQAGFEWLVSIFTDMWDPVILGLKIMVAQAGEFFSNPFNRHLEHNIRTIEANMRGADAEAKKNAAGKPKSPPWKVNWSEDYNNWVEKKKAEAKAAEPAGPAGKDLIPVVPGQRPQVDISTNRVTSNTAITGDYAEMIANTSQKYGIIASTIAGIIARESSWNPNAEGPTIPSGIHQGTRAIGLGQIMPVTARDAGIDPNTLWDPATNIDAIGKVLTMKAKALGLDVNDPRVIEAYLGKGKDLVTGVSTGQYRSDVLSLGAQWAGKPLISQSAAQMAINNDIINQGNKNQVMEIAQGLMGTIDESMSAFNEFIAKASGNQGGNQQQVVVSPNSDYMGVADVLMRDSNRAGNR